MPVFDATKALPWARRTRSKILARTEALGAGELLTDETGALYVGDGVTQVKDLGRVARLAELLGVIPTSGARAVGKGELMINVADYGAKGDLRATSSAVATAGSAVITSSGNAFAGGAASVGQWFFMPGAGASRGTTSAVLSTAAPINSIPVNALGTAVPRGLVTLNDGAASQTFVTSGAASGATAIPVDLATPVAAFASGTAISLPLSATITAVAANGSTVTLSATAGSSGRAGAEPGVAQWGSDNTAAITAALTAAGAARGVLFFPWSPYPYAADGLVFNQRYVTLRGAHAAGYYYGGSNANTPTTAVTVMQLPGSSNTLARVHVQGVTCDNLQFDGNRRSGTGTVLEIGFGFELRGSRIRVVNGGAVGFDVQSACNVHLPDVFVDNCGAHDAAGVSIASAVRIGVAVSDGSRTLNTLGLQMLNIERSQGKSLSIGTTGVAGNYPEFLRILDLHIEGYTDTYELVELADLRSVEFVNPFLYGVGIGPLVVVDQNAGLTSQVLGGVVLNGGSLCGGNPGATPTTQPVNLIRLKRGNGFKCTSRLISCSGPAVLIDATYGTLNPVIIEPSSVDRVGTVVLDNRPTAYPPVRYPKVGTCLGMTSYVAASNTTYNTPNGTVNMVDGTNIRLPITVPESGRVLVKMSGTITYIGAVQTSWLAYNATGVQLGTGEIITSFTITTSDTDVLTVAGRLRGHADILLTGLTPGALVLTLAHTANGVGNTLLCGPSGGPVVVEAYAA